MGWVFFQRWLATLTLAGAVSAAELRVLTLNVQDGVGAPGTAAHEAVRETLARLAPDVIAFQEVAAQNTNPAHATHFADLKVLLTSLGFGTTRAHLATAGDGFQGRTYSPGDFGTSTQCLALASRHPIVKTAQIGRGLAGRREHTRFPLFVRIDVPDTTNDPAFVVAHFKQGGTMADEFRRGLEALRVRQFLAAEGLHGDTHHVFVLGDMNEQVVQPQTNSFTTTGVTGGHRFSDGSTLPATFALGPDVPATWRYAVFPISGFLDLGLSPVTALQTDGVTDRTYHPAGRARLDYLFAGAFTHAQGAVRAEVYHSGREAIGDGLPKDASLPDPALSHRATDHLPVFADVLLDPMPTLTLTLPTTVTPVDVAGAAPLTGSVALPAPTTAPVTVTLAPFRAAPLRPLAPVVIPAGETSATFSVVVEGSPYGRDRRLTLLAQAEGYRVGVGTVATRRDGALGEVLLSQYTEAPTGNSPKAIEVMNVSGRELVLAMEPLRVLAYTNGAATSTTEATVEQGTLPPGEVLVIGDGTTGEFLRAQGRLSVTAAALSGAPNGTVFTHNGELSGRVVFVKDSFAFNGNDALEVRLNAARGDVFGQPGHNPGVAWTTPGPPRISTANQNLTRRRDAPMPSAGWLSPGLVYEVVTAGPLAGFGEAPALEDPYARWAAGLGRTGAAAAPETDPDGNGVPNAMEFLFGGDPTAGFLFTRDPATDEVTLRLTHLVRTRPGRLRWGMEVSDALGHWRPLLERAAPLAPAAEVFAPESLALPLGSDGPRFVRFFVTAP